MIYGLKLWNDKDTYYTQTNNPQEEILRKEDGGGFLESCGPTAAVSIVHAIGKNVKITCPGEWSPQPESVLFNFFHDQRNYVEFKKIRTGLNPYNYFNNRVPQFYPYALMKVFNVKALFEWKSLSDIQELLKSNIGIMPCLRKPGHYISIVAYDSDTEEVIYNDPWPNNFWPSSLNGTSGFNRRILLNKLTQNINGYRIVIGG